MTAPAGLTEAEAKTMALQSEKVQKLLNGQNPKKVIVIKGKLVNIVI